MKRVVLMALGLVAGAGLAAADAPAFSVSYDQKTTMGREVTQSKVSMLDELFRMETTMQGQQSIIVHNEQGTFIVMPSEGMAMKTEIHPGQGAVAGGDNYGQYLQQQQAQKTGSETVDGHDCDIYQFTSAEGEATTAWVRTDIMFPVKLEVQSPQGKVLVELSNIQLDAPVSRQDFELPAGVQVMDMGNMMGMGMGQRN